MKFFDLFGWELVKKSELHDLYMTLYIMDKNLKNTSIIPYERIDLALGGMKKLKEKSFISNKLNKKLGWEK